MTEQSQWTSAAPKPQYGKRPKWAKTKVEAHHAMIGTRDPNQGLTTPTQRQQPPQEETSLVSAVENQATMPKTAAPKLNKGSTLWTSTPNTKWNTKATKFPSTE